MIPEAGGTPFDDMRRLIAMMPGPDEAAAAAVRERERNLTKPAGSLGRLEWLVEWLAAWQAKAPPTVERPLVAVFAASHGVAARGVSGYPPEVNRQMLENFSAGGAAINQICASFNLGFKVFDLALDVPTADIVAVAGGTDLLAVGEMGIGNTTVAAAIYAALYGGAPEAWVGRGTGVDDAGYARKLEAVTGALARHAGHLDEPLEVLRRLGGRDVAAIAGAIVAARLQRIPVVLDGYVATAAAAVLHALEPAAIDHCVAGHLSAEGAHQAVLDRLGKIPLLALGMRLGEGSGAALAVALIRAAAACHCGMATFDEARVAGRIDRS